MTISDPKLLDKVVLEMNAAMLANISWLDNAYGKAERLRETNQGGEVVYPAVYTGRDKEYLKLFPDDSLGNFSFIEIRDTQELFPEQSKKKRIRCNLSVIFWFDFRKIYSTPNTYTIENVKNELLDFFSRYTFKTFLYDVEMISEEVENIYSGLGYNVNSNQFNMRPYGCLKISGEVATKICVDGAMPIVTLPVSVIQSDWNETNINSNAFIKNKPTIPEPLTLYSTTEANTGLTDENGDVIYCKSYMGVVDANLISGGRFVTDLSAGDIKKIIKYTVDKQVISIPERYFIPFIPVSGFTSGGSYIDYSLGGSPVFIHNLSPITPVGSPYPAYADIRIYYTKN